MRRGAALVSDRGLIGRAPPVAIHQLLAPTPGSLPVIRLGVIGAPSDANPHSLANPVVAGATCIRTPPLACPPEPGGARALPALRLAQVGTATRERKCRRRNCRHVCAGASWVHHTILFRIARYASARPNDGGSAFRGWFVARQGGGSRRGSALLQDQQRTPQAQDAAAGQPVVAHALALGRQRRDL
jgi:hypothetical protein